MSWHYLIKNKLKSRKKKDGNKRQYFNHYLKSKFSSFSFVTLSQFFYIHSLLFVIIAGVFVVSLVFFIALFEALLELAQSLRQIVDVAVGQTIQIVPHSLLVLTCLCHTHCELQSNRPHLALDHHGSDELADVVDADQIVLKNVGSHTVVKL